MTEVAHTTPKPLKLIPGRRSKLATELESIAKAAALYYWTLIEEGVPLPLAKTMLLEWHHSFMGWEEEDG